MNGFKNFIICLLSVIILVQSAFLIYFLRRQAPREKIARPASMAVPVRGKTPEIAPVAPPEKIPSKPALGKIVLVLDDWGYNLKNRSFITDNDFHVTLSILPFHPFSTQIADLAAQNHKGVMIHMPMEPHNKENYGLEERTLLTTMDRATILKTLDAAYGTVPHARGVNNHMGSKATEDVRFMKIVLEYLKKKEMFFLDSYVTPRSVCRKLARNLKIPFAEREVFIDNESDPAYIRAQVLKLAARAKRVGLAIGIGHDRPNTVAVLKEIIPQLEAEGYQFVNLCDIIQQES